MCLIAYSPTGRAIPADVFESAVTQNEDGIGVMSLDGVAKFIGRKFKKRAKRYLRSLADAGQPYGVHWRYATHGRISRRNTHPHFVPSSDAVVMHNGVLSLTAAEATEELSDTALFCEQYLPSAPDHSDSGYYDYWRKVADMIGYGNKFLVMHADTGRFTLVNEDAGEWIDGLWYSNTYSLPDYMDRWSNPYYGSRKFGYGETCAATPVAAPSAQVFVGADGRLHRVTDTSIESFDVPGYEDDPYYIAKAREAGYHDDGMTVGERAARAALGLDDDDAASARVLRESRADDARYKQALRRAAGRMAR